MTNETLRFGTVDLDDDPTTHGGRKEGRILTLGSIEHSLSDGQSNMRAGTTDLTLADTAGRPIGTRLADPSKKFFFRDGMVVKALSDAGRRAGVDPRVLARMLITDGTYTGPLNAQFHAVDPFFVESGIFGPDKKFPYTTIPTSLGGTPIFVATPTGVEPVSVLSGPADVYAKPCPVILGEVSDHGARDAANGAAKPRGKCPLYYTGQDLLPTGPGGANELWGRFVLCQFACYKITDLFGLDLDGMLYGIKNATSNGATQSVIQLPAGTDLSFVLTTGADQILLYTYTKGVVSAQIVGKDEAAHTVTVNATIAPSDTSGISGPGIDWMITPAKPCRGPVDLKDRNGIDVMVPKWPGYIRPKPYEDVKTENGKPIRLTIIWVRGPLMWAHITGQVTLAANVIGVEDKGDGTGLPITDYFTAYYWWWINCVIYNTLAPGGVGFENKFPQTDGDIAALGGAWEDNATYKVNGNSFRLMQEWSQRIFPGGFKISAWFGDTARSMRDVAQLFNDNGACRTGENEFGQIVCKPLSVDTTVDPFDAGNPWPRVEHVSRVFSDVTRTNPLAEVENVTQGQCDYDADAQQFRQPLQTEEGDGSGIAHNKGVRVLSKLIGGYLISNPDQFRAVLRLRWRYAKDGPVYVTFTGDHGLLDYPLGSGIVFTSTYGPGAIGYVDQPLVILSKKFDLTTHLVTYTCLDVGSDSGMGLLVPPAQRAVFSNNTAIAGRFSDNQSIAQVVTQ